MVTFLHTADLQLGMRARDASARGQALREARLTTLQTIVDVARARAVDFLVIAGDLFEDNQVHARTVARAVQILHGAAPIPVFILPGNHDPLDSGSVYHRAEFRPPHSANITVLRAAEPLPVRDDCLLYPCPLTDRWSYADPTAWIPPREAETRIRIGIAHGGLPIRPEVEHPIGIDAAAMGLDYLALGDWHGQSLHHGAVAYAGTPEQTSFGEDGAGAVLLVTIAAAGSPPVIESHPVNTLTCAEWTRELAGAPDAALQGVRDAISALPEGKTTVLRLTLTGVVPADALPQVDALAVWLAARADNGDLLHAECRRAVQTTEAREHALRALAEGDPLIQQVLDDLRERAGAEDAPADERQAAEDAIALLAGLAMEVAA
ncbi:MAG TPA: DNA repair exonuclease [Armatimonadota bacterium]|nr:DNA repair exonuclease [Armatimonadota bacterium]